MATALTLFPTSTADTLVTTANTLVTTAPNAEAVKTSKTGKSTAWGVLWSQGNTGTWAASASEPAGDVHGFLYDNTVLEGQTLLAGTYTLKAKLSTSSGTVTGVLHCQISKRSSAGVFSTIVDIAFPSTGFTSTAAVITGTGTTVTNTDFAVGDKLYAVYFLNITANTSASTTATTSLFENLSTNESIVTPGYTLLLNAPAGSYSLSGQDSVGSIFPLNGSKTYYKLDENSGTVAHDSIGSQDATLTANGGTATWATGEINSGVQTDGLSYITTNTQIDTLVGGSLSAGSVSCWAKPSGAFNDSLEEGLWSVRTTDGSGAIVIFHGLKFTDNHLYFGFFDNVGGVAHDSRIVVAASATNWTQNAWMHVAFTWASGTYTAYVNGVSIGTSTPGFTLVVPAASFLLGYDLQPQQSITVDEYGFWNRALTQTEVTQLYNSGVGVSYPIFNGLPGSFNLTGQDATLTTGSAGSVTLTAPAGSYSLTGKAASLDDALNTSPSTFSLTSSSANLNSAVSTSPGSFNLTGQTANLNRALTTSPGSFTLTSSSAGLNSSLISSVTSFSLTSQAATLNNTLTTAVGSFALTGQAAILNDALNDIPPGSYNLTGQDATLTLTGGITLTAPVGTYNLTGEPAGLNTSLTTSSGTFNLTGQSSTVNSSLITSPSSFNLTGSSSLVNTTLNTSTGSFNLTGQTSNANNSLVGSVTSFSLTGQPLTSTNSLTTSPGSFNLTGKASTLNDTLTAAATSFNLTGSDATFNITGPITFITSVTSFIVIGQDGTLSLTTTPSTSSPAITNTSNNLFRGAPTPFTVPIPIEEFFRPTHKDFKNYDEDENKRKRGIEEEALLLKAYRKIEHRQRILKEDEEYLLKL